MPMWESIFDLVRMEIVERREEGCDVAGFSERAEAMRDRDEDLMKLYQELAALPVRPGFPYSEPDDLEQILLEAGAPGEGSGLQGTDAERRDLFYGAWLGRCIGCALGKPVEAYPFVSGKDGKTGYEWIRMWLEGADAYPLSDYFPAQSAASDQIHIVCPDSQ